MSSFIKTSRDLLVFFGTALLCLQASALVAAEDQVERIFEVEPGGTLYIESDPGAIEVNSWDQERVRIRATDADDFDIEMEQRGNDVSVIAERRNGFFNFGRNNIRFQVDVPTRYNLDLNTSGGGIRVGPISGDVYADTSGGSIEIDEVTGGDVEVDTSGGRIRIGNVDGSVIADTSGGSINIGNVTGYVEADTSGGSITIGDVGGDITADTSGGGIDVGRSGGRVELDTSGGTIRAGWAEGPISVDTSGGNIFLAGSAVRVEADTSGGNIEVERSGGAVYADTSGGSITIRQAVGPIRADTAGGRIDAELIAYDGDRDATIELETAGGDIVLRIPANHRASVLADVEVNRSGRGRYSIESDFPLAIEEDSRGNILGRGDINGGGDIIYLETTNSNIRIVSLGN
ncbi:MAG: DUF4097 family beta strand repeat-containing protein [Pseudohongiellaceae bacterium]